MAWFEYGHGRVHGVSVSLNHFSIFCINPLDADLFLRLVVLYLIYQTNPLHICKFKLSLVELINCKGFQG